MKKIKQHLVTSGILLASILLIVLLASWSRVDSKAVPPSEKKMNAEVFDFKNEINWSSSDLVCTCKGIAANDSSSE